MLSNMPMKIKLSINSKNEDIYRYAEDINIENDIINGINLLNENKRDTSLFLLQTASLYVKHNLHRWNLEFLWEISRKRLYTGTYQQNITVYYEHIFYISFYLKDFPSVGFKKKRIGIIEPENIK